MGELNSQSGYFAEEERLLPLLRIKPQIIQPVA
jgi:hypothetical protein